ncbi:MAG: SAM-dependent methyltransferase [Tenericutes bacterium HGW-Tenericutes-6]|nr:MAG: SAM-dependent methyltransferase [Tenericutes bacterium HGW-Tenericutes-6]PKK97245.1 MAG: SAM-dependent methyltransferase [Tenericutes bacterium HGW-Tenericutes-3]
MLEVVKAYAKDHQVPIICEDGLLFLSQVIKDYQVKDVLEIGTAIGYSALAMASFGCSVDTIERNKEMADLAKKNIKAFDLNHRVSLIEADALLYDGDLRMYDLIFIDAAKAQYQKFFEKYMKYLNPNGVIVCDNLRFHDLKPENVNRHTKQLLRKINTFKTFLVNHPDFETKFFETGDGMTVSQRKTK